MSKQALGEIALIFISITLALYFNNWNQNRLNRQTEHLYLQALRDDLEADIESLSDFAKRSRDHISTPVEGAVKHLLNNDLGQSDTLAFINQIMMANYFNTIRLHDATFQDLTGSGNLHLLSNFEIRRQLLDYHSSLEFFTFYYEGMWNFRINVLSAMMNEKIPMWLHTRWYDYLDHLSEQDKRVNLNQLFDDMELENGLLTIVLFERWQQASFDTLRSQAEELRALIDSELR